MFDSNFVQMTVIYAHPHHPICILYKQYRFSPRRHTGSNIPFLYQLLQLQFEFHQFWCTHAVRDLESRTDPKVISMEKSRSRFKGNSGISSRNSSFNYSIMGKSSMHCFLLDSMSRMFTENNLYPFLMHFLLVR